MPPFSPRQSRLSPLRWRPIRKRWAVLAFLPLGVTSGESTAHAARLSADPTPMVSVLGYEGIVSLERGPSGIETEIAACTASVIDLPGVGPRVVTAAHCGGHDPTLFDDRLSIRALSRRQTEGGPDIAVLEPRGKLPWQAFQTRPSSTLRVGEMLCAYRVRHSGRSVLREEVCAPFLGRTLRIDGGQPRLVVGHAFEQGTSGSPLFDALSRVVGIVVSTTDREGFAEPIEAASAIAQAPAISGGQNPPAPAAPGHAWPLSGVPREGSFCLPGLCLRWQI